MRTSKIYFLATVRAGLVVGLLIAFGGNAFGDSLFKNDDVQLNSDTSPRKYYVEDIKQAMEDYVAEQVDENGVFHLRDDKTGEMLALKFLKIHDPVRKINSSTYFACTDFHVAGEPKKLYDLDFWMNPVTGELKIYDTKVHKEPRKSLLYGWYKQPRYTFVNDRVISLY
jgi:hypothetical protein